MKKKKLLLPILLLAPAFLASQVAADEQTAPETNLEVAAASTTATDAATPASTEANAATSEGASYQRCPWSDRRRKGCDW